MRIIVAWSYREHLHHVVGNVRQTNPDLGSCPGIHCPSWASGALHRTADMDMACSYMYLAYIELSMLVPVGATAATYRNILDLTPRFMATG